MSHSTIRFDNSMLPNVWKADDDWTGLKKKEERKKRQNRLNQRAYRLRKSPKDPPPAKRHPFRVERFRIPRASLSAEQEEVTSTIESSQTTSNSAISADSSDSVTTEELVEHITTRVDALAPRHFVPRETLALLAIDLQDPESSVLSSAAAKYLQQQHVATTTAAHDAVIPTAALQLLDDAILQLEDEQPFVILKSKLLAIHFGCDLVQSPFNIAHTASQALSTLSDTLMNKTYFPLSSDHLLHLIHFNVFRALISNKLLLNDTTTLLRAGVELVLPEQQNLCEGLSLVRAKTRESIPPNLYPTTKQMSIAHSSWLNMFPFPRVRDNLILHQQRFNHRDLCNDLFGEVISRNTENSSIPDIACPPGGIPSEVWESWEDDVTARRKGFIVWGEPWDANSWEVTPGFLKKWAWVVDGCKEVVQASNRWRAQRGEPPLEDVESCGPEPDSLENIQGHTLPMYF